jgi:fibrillarin-like rRNA methylase
MRDLRDLETKLAELRRDIAQRKRAGYNETEILKLQRECYRVWAAVEQLKLGGAVMVGGRR